MPTNSTPTVGRLQLLAARQTQFMRDYFPDHNVAACGLKVAHEAIEVAVDPTDIGEQADVVITLLSLLSITGRSADELLDAVDAKITKNEARDWVQNPDGTYSGSHPVVSG